MPYSGNNQTGLTFEYDLTEIEETLFTLAEDPVEQADSSRDDGRCTKLEATIEMMVVEAIKTSAIEELLSRGRMSSMRKNPGTRAGHPEDKRAQGAAR